MTNLRPGIYRHYKGKNYQVFEVARHSETEEEVVVYRCLYGDYSWWVRPLTMFVESVYIEGETLPRFEYVGPAESVPKSLQGVADEGEVHRLG